MDAVDTYDKEFFSILSTQDAGNLQQSFLKLIRQVKNPENRVS